MARLPVSGQDNGTWGNVLNDFLSVELNGDGSLKKASDIVNAQATANAAAVNTSVVHNTGNETIAGTKTFSAAPVFPSASFPESAVINLTTDLSAKIDKSIATTKGDLLAATAASTIARVGIGADGQILTADAASSPGVKWAPAPVTSVVGQTGVITGTQIAADPALTSAYGSVVIQPTGVAATDTAALQAAHDALPANGGEIKLGAGTFLLSATGLSFTKSVKMVGQGKSGGAVSVAGGYNVDKSITRIEYPFGTGNAISVAANACVFQDFHLINTTVAAPTAGAGIVVTSGGVGFEYRSISVAGFYRNIDHGNGFEWQMISCTLFDFVVAGLRIANPTLPDGGDMGIQNCQIMAGPNRTTASYGIEWRSAGGLRVINCKFNKRGNGAYTIGILLNPADGIQTGVFEIVGNSFENMTYGIFSDDSGVTGTGNISQLVISSNEFYTGSRGIIFQRANAGHLSQVVVASNMFRSITPTSTATGGLTLKNIDTVSVSNNLFKDNIQEASRIIVQTGVTNLSTTTIIQTGQTIGTAVLNGATPVVVTSGVVTASSVIQLTQQAPGGTQSGIAFVVSRIAGTSFSIASVAGDTSTVGWQITEPR